VELLRGRDAQRVVQALGQARADAGDAHQRADVLRQPRAQFIQQRQVAGGK
jgi:hypothetical protein